MNKGAGEKDATVFRKYRPYPAYKNSGVEWLGKIPESWVITRAKNIFREINESSKDGSETLLSVSEYFGVKPRNLITVGKGGLLTRAETLEGYKICHKGDLIINIMLAWKTGLGFSRQGGIVSPAYAIFRIQERSEMSSKYLNLLLRSPIYVSEFKKWSYGIIDSRLRLYPEIFLRINILRPPAMDQEVIANFLECETAKIDALIAKQERLIELLQEKRTALITHAVTKGLDPNAPMKDSGLEWLGEIPAHWRLKPTKYLFQIMNGSTPNSSEPDYWNGDLPWVTPEDLGVLDGFIISETRRNITLNGYLSCATNMVPVGSIIVSTRAPIGHIAIAQVELCTNQGCRALIPSEGLDSKYFYHIFSVVKQELQSFGQGSTFRELSKTDLENLLIPKPPLREQELISEALDKKTSEMDGVIKKTGDSIKLLKEYRTALISAAVTGKIDVREEVSSA